MDIQEILDYLPHRYPFLLIDRVLAFERGRSLTGLKNVSFNEPFFLGHFPQRPIMPGVLILEALAQAAGILCFVTAGVYPDESVKFYFAGIDEARFRRPVLPGDQLRLSVTLERRIRTIWRFGTVADVDGQQVCSAKMMVMPG